MRRILMASLVVLIVGGVVAGYFTRAMWKNRIPFLMQQADDAEADQADDAPHGGGKIKLSQQARENLGLRVESMKPDEYWRKIQLPGQVIDQPGHDLLVSTPTLGVITRVHVVPGDIVKPGDLLFTLRIISDHNQTLQQQYHQAKKQLVLVERQKKDLDNASRTGVVSETRILELDRKVVELQSLMASAKDSLRRHGLTDAQLQEVADGKFVTQMSIVVPLDAKAHVVPEVKPTIKAEIPTPPREPSPGNIHEEEFEVQVVSAQLGERVDAAKTLAVLANHNHLYIEGHGFKKEAALLEEAMRKNWDIEVEFAEDDQRYWPPITQSFHIQWMGNKIDEKSRTFPFYLQLDNQSRVYQKNDKTYLVWRFRPGQRLRLRVPVAKFEDVFVIPREGVVRDGPETYVFRQNGESFERKPVHVLYEDQENFVFANDGSIFPGSNVAQNGASALNRVLQSQSNQGGGHHHHHH